MLRFGFKNREKLMVEESERDNEIQKKKKKEKLNMKWVNGG